jgi:YVTN family beta-propeller protein
MPTRDSADKEAFAVMDDFERRLRAAMESAVASEQPPGNLAGLVRRRHRRHVARVAVAVAAVIAAALAAVPPTWAALLGGTTHAAAGPAQACPSSGPQGAGGPIAYFDEGATVRRVNLATGTQGKPIKVGSYPWEIVIAPDGKTAYVIADVGSRASKLVTPINLATDTAGKPINVGAMASAIAIAPDGKTAYVTSPTSNTSGTVTPINLATDKPGKPINVGANAWAIAITPDGKTAYVALSNLNPVHPPPGWKPPADTVRPVNLVTSTPGKPIKVGSNPYAIAITPDGKTAYVANANSGTVTPIATATNTPGKPINVGLPGPEAIAITPDGKTAYVLSGIARAMVTPIDLATNTPGKPINVGQFPGTIAITPDGKTAYVSSGIAQTMVTPIDLATNTPGKPINLGFYTAGGSSEAFAIMPLTCRNQVVTHAVTKVASGSLLAGWEITLMIIVSLVLTAGVAIVYLTNRPGSKPE